MAACNPDGYERVSRVEDRPDPSAELPGASVISLARDFAAHYEVRPCRAAGWSWRRAGGVMEDGAAGASAGEPAGKPQAAPAAGFWRQIMSFLAASFQRVKPSQTIAVTDKARALKAAGRD